MQELDCAALLQWSAASRREPPAPPPLLLDVREAWEVEVAALRIDGIETRHMPMAEIARRHAELDASQPVVCFCHHGVRSAQVVAFLQRRGFGSVYNLVGGIDAWSVQADPALSRY